MYSTENQYINKNFNEKKYLINIQFENIAIITIESGKTIDQYELSQHSKSTRNNNLANDNNEIKSLFASVFSDNTPIAKNSLSESKKPYESK